MERQEFQKKLKSWAPGRGAGEPYPGGGGPGLLKRHGTDRGADGAGVRLPGLPPGDRGGLCAREREEEEEAQLTLEEEDFLKQYQKELEYLTLLEEKELLELCEQAENTETAG